MVRWGLAIDLKSCAGCQTCTIACKLDNSTPPGILWRSVKDIEVGKYPEVRRFFLPMQCMHCANPPCMHVCPTTATKKRSDGIVYVDYEKCIGCGYCILACPFDARSLVKEEASYFPTGGSSGAGRSMLGIVTKCDFCFDRVDLGSEGAMRIGIDPEATPVCVNSCPARAITIGDLDDHQSEVSKVVRERDSFRLRPELKTDPSVYYLW